MYLGTFPLTGTFSLSLDSLFSILCPFLLIVLALQPNLNYMLLSLIPYRLTSIWWSASVFRYVSERTPAEERKDAGRVGRRS